MNYKEVLEEQIRRLQKVQSEIPYPGPLDDVKSQIMIAQEIRLLIDALKNLTFYK